MKVFQSHFDPILCEAPVCFSHRLLSFAALVVYCTKSRRAERYWQKTLLQMEEMESQIREEIRKGGVKRRTLRCKTLYLPVYVLVFACKTMALGLEAVSSEVGRRHKS